jgi:hypothetical protein
MSYLDFAAWALGFFLVGVIAARWAFNQGVKYGIGIGVRDVANRLAPLLARSGVPWEIVEAVLLRDRPRHQKPRAN